MAASTISAPADDAPYRRRIVVLEHAHPNQDGHCPASLPDLVWPAPAGTLTMEPTI